MVTLYWLEVTAQLFTLHTPLCLAFILSKADWTPEDFCMKWQREKYTMSLSGIKLQPCSQLPVTLLTETSWLLVTFTNKYCNNTSDKYESIKHT